MDYHDELSQLLRKFGQNVTEFRKGFYYEQPIKYKRVGIIDSGVDLDIPVIDSKNISNNRSFVDNNSLGDSLGHGTAVASLLILYYPKIILSSYKVIGKNQKMTKLSIINNALESAILDGNDVINISLSAIIQRERNIDELLQLSKLISIAQKKGIFIVNSVGNNHINLQDLKQGEIHLFSEFDSVISVGSIRYNKSLTSYTNYGRENIVFAYGGDLLDECGKPISDGAILTAFPFALDNGLDSFGIPQGFTLSVGTSFATPAVIIALLMIKSTVQEVDTNNILEIFQKSLIINWNESTKYKYIDPVTIFASILRQTKNHFEVNSNA